MYKNIKKRRTDADGLYAVIEKRVINGYVIALHISVNPKALNPLNIAEVLTMRQIFVLRIHPYACLVCSGL